jgi:hypothetical protein
MIAVFRKTPVPITVPTTSAVVWVSVRLRTSWGDSVGADTDLLRVNEHDDGILAGTAVGGHGFVVGYLIPSCSR